ncbi:MAG: hypothetical protein WB773_05960, partial [Isosphaeraceae bacterium]
MSVITKLDLPTSPRAAVFRAMETIVRQNSVFNRIVKPDRFRTWQGEPRDIKPFSYQEAPCIRWTPMNTGEEFKTPDTMAGDLLINCEVIVAGSCCDDLTNFWWLLTRCFYPPSGGAPRQAIIQTLQAAGARSGLVLFSQPAFDPGPDGVFFAGQGQIKIEIQSQLN